AHLKLGVKLSLNRAIVGLLPWVPIARVDDEGCAGGKRVMDGFYVPCHTVGCIDDGLRRYRFGLGALVVVGLPAAGKFQRAEASPEKVGYVLSIRRLHYFTH